MRTLLACALAAATATQAATFRCDERLGTGTTYQNDPCPGGTFQREIRLVEPPPPQLFAVPESGEILARPPVRVVPLIGDEQASIERPER